MNILAYLLEKYPNKNWRWDYISCNLNITMEIIEKYPNKPWNWILISCNPNLTMEMIEKYSNKDWDWNFISRNPNITMDIIYLDKIDFKWLSDNKFTYETKRLKKKEAYWLLEASQVFNKTANLVILDKYM